MERIFKNYVTYTALVALAVVLTGLILTQITLGLVMPLFCILQIYMLRKYPQYIKLSPEFFSDLLKWNVRIQLAHAVLDLVVIIWVMIIASLLHDITMAMLIFGGMYLLGRIPACITSVLSCRELTSQAAEKNLSSSVAAYIHMILHALPVFSLISAIVLGFQIRKKETFTAKN